MTFHCTTKTVHSQLLSWVYAPSHQSSFNMDCIDKTLRLSFKSETQSKSPYFRTKDTALTISDWAIEHALKNISRLENGNLKLKIEYVVNVRNEDNLGIMSLIFFPLLVISLFLPGPQIKYTIDIEFNPNLAIEQLTVTEEYQGKRELFNTLTIDGNKNAGPTIFKKLVEIYKYRVAPLANWDAALGLGRNTDLERTAKINRTTELLDSILSSKTHLARPMAA